MMESVATLLILNVLVTASSILDSHGLGDLKVVFSWKNFASSFRLLFVTKNFFVAGFTIQINHRRHRVINLDANYKQVVEDQALCEVLSMHHRFNTPNSPDAFSILEMEKPCVVRAHRWKGGVGGVLDLGFSDQGYLAEWDIWQCPLELLLDVGVHLSCPPRISWTAHFIDEELVLEGLHLFWLLLQVFSAPQNVDLDFSKSWVHLMLWSWPLCMLWATHHKG